MIEKILQAILEFFKEVWFQLDALFGLRDTKVFAMLQPYLMQLEKKPLLIATLLVALFLLPYGLFKVRSISKVREQKLDDLMEEMEEEVFDEDDPRKLRRPEAETVLDSTLEDEKPEEPLLSNDDSNGEQIENPLFSNNDFKDEEISETELDGLKLETSELEKGKPPVSTELAGSEFDKDLNEFIASELDLSEKNREEVFEINDSSHRDITSEFQKEGELIEFDPEPSVSGSENEELSPEDAFTNYSDLDEEEQDEAIKDLQNELEQTINQFSKQIDEPQQDPTEPDQISLGSNIEKKASESSSDSHESSEPEFLDSLEPELESNLEQTLSPESFPLDADKTDLETSPDASSFESEELEADPVIKGKVGTKDSDESDSLINRLKFLQTRFENRYQPTANKILDPTPIRKQEEERFIEPRQYTSESASAPPDSKKYMELLESFIFMKDQKKHK